MEACYGGTDVMESCAVARGIDINNGKLDQFALYHQHFMWLPCFCFPCRTSLQ
jgi:hypothetical protein